MMKTILKDHKGILILTSILTLLPVLAGLLLWDILPDVLVTHWGINGEPDGYMSKSAVVFGLPLVMLALQWFGILATLLDKRNTKNRKMLTIVWWIVPVVSILCGAVTYGYALNIPVNTGSLVLAVLGILFAVIGWFLPRCQQNRTMGIRLPWTLASEENWNKTHRLAGAVWVAGGVLVTLTSPLANLWLSAAVFLLMILIPAVYSYRYAKTKENI